jgi:anti-sigma regulatory factor (Ser/Thr protein kinase)
MGDPAAAIGRVEPSVFVRRIWPAHPRELALMRAEVRRWLVPLALAGDVEGDVVLAVSEAASNSVEHAYIPATAHDTVDVTFWTEPHALYIEIVDHGVWQTPSDQPTGCGRGIGIMQRLMAFVLIRHDTRGTRVLPRHPLPGSPSPRCTTLPPASRRPASAAAHHMRTPLARRSAEPTPPAANW